MSAAHRTGGSRGKLEIDIRLKGFGRFRMTSDTHKATVRKRRESLARLLAELGQLDVLRALKAGSLAWSSLEEANRKQRLTDASLMADLLLAKTLRAAIDETLPRMGPTEITRDRYRVALAGLSHLGFDLETDTVASLKRDAETWAEHLEKWKASPATKNNVRTAVSRLLTRLLGNKGHAFRLEVLHEDRWKLLRVPRRVRGVAAVDFWSLMGRVPERGIASYVVLSASGMRVGEYLHPSIRVDEAHHTVTTTGKTGPKTYSIDPHAWEYVRQAIPCRVSSMRRTPTRLQNDPRYKRLYLWLRKAGKELGIEVTIHDLRRLYVRLGVEAKGQVATQHAVGHETPAMTAEYSRWRNQAEVSTAVAQGLGLAPSAEMSGKKSGKSKRSNAK